MSDSVPPHRQQPTRLPHPWDSPGKSTGVGCHFFLQCRKVKSKSEVAQSCPTLSNSTDCGPPGSSVHGIFPGKSTGVGCHCLLRLESLGPGKSLSAHSGFLNKGSDLLLKPRSRQQSLCFHLFCLVLCQKLGVCIHNNLFLDSVLSY